MKDRSISRANDSIITAVERLPIVLRELFNKWETLDPELREHYCHELMWVLSTCADLLEDEPKRLLNHKLSRSIAELHSMDNEIECKVGFKSSEILPALQIK